MYASNITVKIDFVSERERELKLHSIKKERMRAKRRSETTSF
jgi:hypothetical protein